MLGTLITQPKRIATRTIQLSVHTAQDAIHLAEGIWGLARSVVGSEPAPSSPEPADFSAEQPTPAAAPDPSAPAQSPDPAAPPATADPVAHADAVIEGRVVEEVTDRAPDDVPPFADAPVDDEPELVEAVAEAGAEDGAGAEIHVAEPWENYRLMTAGQIVDRLATATPEELAAVELYELSGRRRSTVLNAAKRRLKAASPPRGGADAA